VGHPKKKARKKARKKVKKEQRRKAAATLKAWCVLKDAFL
jgi:hypothetical protein